MPNICATNLTTATLYAVLCTMEEIPNEQALAIITKQLEQLCSKEGPGIFLVLKTMYVITQKAQTAETEQEVMHAHPVMSRCRTK